MQPVVGEEILILSANSGLWEQWHHHCSTDCKIQARTKARGLTQSLSELVRKRRHKALAFESWQALRVLSWPFVRAHGWACRRLTPLTFLQKKLNRCKAAPSLSSSLPCIQYYGGHWMILNSPREARPVNGNCEWGPTKGLSCGFSWPFTVLFSIIPLKRFLLRVGSGLETFIALEVIHSLICSFLWENLCGKKREWKVLLFVSKYRLFWLCRFNLLLLFTKLELIFHIQFPDKENGPKTWSLVSEALCVSKHAKERMF